jgi:hypothetical protein
MRVYFTVDTESSIGGAWNHPDRRPLEAARHVFCRIGAKDFGIPLLTELLQEHGFTGTFFVETLATRCLGEADTRAVFDYLLARGQDVQLHIHPVFRIYAEALAARQDGRDPSAYQPMDLIGRFSEEAQLDFLGEAIEFFESFAGRRPVAFRAGCFAGSRSMLRSLHTLGIRVDSSFNPYYPQVSFPGEPLEPNLVQKLEGVWELPVTVAQSRLPESYGRLKFADCTSLCFEEIRAMLDATATAGFEHFVLVFHSFSAVKARDVTFAEMRPNHIVIRRLRKMFRYLAEHPARFQVETMGSVAQHPELFQNGRRVSVLPRLNLGQSLARKTVQLINNAYWV